MPGVGTVGLGEQFSGAVRVAEAQVVVTAAGEIDIATAPHFRALMAGAAAIGAPRVTVDLAEVGFLDASGLSVLVLASQRLRITGASLVVRGCSAWIYRVFELAGLTESLTVERAEVDSVLARALADAAAIPVARAVLDAALQLVVTMAQAVVAGADGASITLPRQGQLGTVAASNDVVLEMDHDQYDTGEGPCLDAATQGERFHVDSLLTEKRWPAFIPRARARGIESILSTPLVAAGQPVGALNIYSRTVGAFAAHERQWADQFAAEAATVISSASLGADAASLSAEIEQALLSREVVALAQGVVMHRDGLSSAAAHVMLRDLSRSTGRPLRDVCEDLLKSAGDPPTTLGLPGGSDHGRRTH